MIFKLGCQLAGVLLSVSLLASTARQPKTGKVLPWRKPFVIGSLLGQVGNRLFEVATASAAAWDNDAQAYFPDFDRSSLDFIHIFFRCRTSLPSAPVEFEWSFSPYGYQPIPFHPNMRLSGYFQNEKYFARYRERLLKLFRPRGEDLKYINKKYKAILDDPKSVSVHLRYYYAEKPDEDAYVQYDREYFTKAMVRFPQDSLFVVTSDNMEFARRNIPTDWGRVVFIEHEPMYIDFLLQRLCRHNIISNSTFSWWSAWLNENRSKIVVRPSVWLAGYPDIGGPDEWIKVDAMGMQERIKQSKGIEE